MRRAGLAVRRDMVEAFLQICVTSLSGRTGDGGITPADAVTIKLGGTAAVDRACRDVLYAEITNAVPAKTG